MALQDNIAVEITPTGVKRSGQSNTLGYFNFEECTTNGGHYTMSSDTLTQDFSSTDFQKGVKGNYVTDVRGNISTYNSGISEHITNGSYTVVTNPELNLRGYQEMANDLQLKAVSARSQPEQVPDTSIIAPIKDMLKPAPNLLDAIKVPESEDLQDSADALTPPTILESVYMMIADEVSKVSMVCAQCNYETAKEMAKIQKNYMKDCAKKALKNMKKMYNDMPTVSKEAFKENMGEMLFPDGGDLSLDSVMNTLNTITDPMKLLGLFMSPSTEKLPKVQNFDEKEYQKIAAENLEKMIEVEKHI